MPRLHALELVPDEAGRDAVLADWQALREAGLPSQLDHKGMTNTPHLTLVAAPALSQEVADRGAEVIGSLLPVTVRTSGLLLLGGKRVTVARTLDVSDELMAAVVGLRREVDGRQHDSWLPHLTLGRRIDRGSVQVAVDALGHEQVELRLTALRRWDPDAGTVTPVSGRGA
ncbi:MAG: 2'-5' RNA ligase family protein [Nocardioides sp.]